MGSLLCPNRSIYEVLEGDLIHLEVSFALPMRENREARGQKMKAWSTRGVGHSGRDGEVPAVHSPMTDVTELPGD